MMNKSTARNIPKAFAESLSIKFGVHQANALIESINSPLPVSIRLHPEKGRHLYESAEQIPWCPEYGRYLPERPNYIWSPEYHAGAYYSQDASCMVFSRYLTGAWDHPIAALDLCAAPGGKSSLIHSYLPKGSLMVSNELIAKRNFILQENSIKWGMDNQIITKATSSDFAPFASEFDLVVVDAPCSGEGMFRKDPGAVEQWSESLVANCAVIQQHLVSDAWKLLAPGGMLIYSTCTFEDAENEAVIKQLLLQAPEAEIINLPGQDDFPELYKVSLNEGNAYYCFWNRLRGEGQFLVALRKPGEQKWHRKQKKTDKLSQKEMKEVASLFSAARADDNSHFIRWREYIVHLNTALTDLAQRIINHLEVYKVGTRLAEVSRNGLIPAHDFLMTNSQHDEFPRIELSHSEALDFLQKKTINPGQMKVRGWNVLTYNNLNLGWGKNVGNRLNVHYPAYWKIRKAPLPEEL